jgi:hypothetical protein
MANIEMFAGTTVFSRAEQTRVEYTVFPTKVKEIVARDHDRLLKCFNAQKARCDTAPK